MHPDDYPLPPWGMRIVSCDGTGKHGALGYFCNTPHEICCWCMKEYLPEDVCPKCGKAWEENMADRTEDDIGLEFLCPSCRRGHR